MATNTSSIWRFVSNFFNFLNDTSRQVYEFLWEGYSDITHENDKKAERFVLAQSPELSRVDPTIDYYDIEISIFTARPIYLDPTSADSRSDMIPKQIIFSTPIGVGRESVRNDMVEISKQDYYDIRSIAIGLYLVINVDDEDVPSKYFIVKDLKSPEETGTRYFDKYVIELENANLSYIPEDDKMTIYLTDAKVYKVDNFVIDIPFLYTNISDETGVTGSGGIRFTKDTDYTFENDTIEFNEDLIGNGTLGNGDYIYAKGIDVIEHNLFTNFGPLVNVRDWKRYRYDNISGKAAINSLMKSLQNPSDRLNYQRALNIYYGLPVAPTDCEVIGLFESYGYEVTAINTGSNELTLDLKSSTSLHPFIQLGSKFMIDTKNIEINIPLSTGSINRTTGVIKIDAGDISSVAVGDSLNLRLNNKMKLLTVNKSYFDDTVLEALHWTGGGDIQHLIDVTYGLGQQDSAIRYPQAIIYGSQDIAQSFDGLYHITRSEVDSFTGNVNLSIDDRVTAYDEPVYNDYIDLDDGTDYTVGPGYVHIPWPTHKYLLLRLSDLSYHKVYIDSPIDTLYAEGDKIDQYTILCRAVSSLNDSIFYNWNEFNGFRGNSGIDLASNILELVNTVPHTKFGTYFPESYQ